MRNGRVRVAVNGYGGIGTRVDGGVALQDDMELAGVAVAAHAIKGLAVEVVAHTVM